MVVVLVEVGGGDVVVVESVGGGGVVIGQSSNILGSKQW